MVERFVYVVVFSVDSNKSKMYKADNLLFSVGCFSLQISRSFSFRNLQSWLRSHIGQNPFGISSCIASGRRLSWPLAGQSLYNYYCTIQCHA